MTRRLAWPLQTTALAHLRRALLMLLDPRRRFNCQDQAAPTWSERADEAVRLLVEAPLDAFAGAPLDIADFGAGNRRLLPVLHRELPVRFDYDAYDLHPQSPEVIRIDLSREVPPRSFDVVFCLGLLEYLSDLDRFAARLRGITTYAITSYALADPPLGLTVSERRERGWRTDLDRAGVEALFSRNGFTVESFSMVNGGRTGIWRWASAREQDRARDEAERQPDA